MTRTIFALFLLSLSCLPAQAQPPVVGEPLPALHVGQAGELTVVGDTIEYRDWQLQPTPGQLHVLQYIDATLSGSKVFREATDAILAQLPAEHLHMTTVINLETATWGTRGFVTRELEASKLEFAQSTLVADDQESARKQWHLNKPGILLVAADEDGRVLFTTSQKLSEPQIDALLKLLQANLPAGTEPAG
jgi:YtfJ family uncharacterized protein